MGDRAAFIIRGEQAALAIIYTRLVYAKCRHINTDLMGVGLLTGWDKASAPGDLLPHLIILCEPGDVELFIVSEKGTTADDYGIKVNPEDTPDPDWERERTT